MCALCPSVMLVQQVLGVVLLYTLANEAWRTQHCCALERHNLYTHDVLSMLLLNATKCGALCELDSNGSNCSNCLPHLQRP
jgi:hypothetical protein